MIKKTGAVVMEYDKTMEIENFIDNKGNPSGGTVKGIGIDIKWQDGPLGRDDCKKEQNGAMVEGVIHSVIERIKFYQESKFNCRENSLAIPFLVQALCELKLRTQRRENDGTEGTHNGN